MEKEMKNDRLFTIPLEVRFRDLDAMGHVNNSVFFSYFEEGRIKLFYSFYKVEDLSIFGFILAHIDCNFLRPIMLHTKPMLQMCVKEIGVKSFKLAYKIVDSADENSIYARGESIQVCFDFKNNKSIKVPEQLKEWLSAYLPTEVLLNVKTSRAFPALRNGQGQQ